MRREPDATLSNFESVDSYRFRKTLALGVYATMADVEVIVIDDSSDDEAPWAFASAAASSAPSTSRSSSSSSSNGGAPPTAAATTTTGGAGPAPKRARIDPSSPEAAGTSSTDDDGFGPIITPSLTGASSIAAAGTAASGAATASALASAAAAADGAGAAAAGSKKRPSPTLGAEAKRLDPSLATAATSRAPAAADAAGGGDEEEATIHTDKPRQTIVDLLTQSKNPPSFCVGSCPMPTSSSIGFPGLCVNGEGHVALPLLPAQAMSLASKGTSHPVKLAPLWQWLPNEISYSNPSFNPGIHKLKQDTCERLGIDPTKVSCVLYKMLLHSAGGQPLNLRNAAVPGNVASIVLMPPALYTGGMITIKREGSPSTSTQYYNFSTTNSYDFAYFSLFDCASYDIAPLQSGSRLMLVYNIIQNDIAAATAAAARATTGTSRPATALSMPTPIRFRDDARIRREFKAVSLLWDISKSTDDVTEKPLIWMTENQYARSHNGKASAKSHFKGTDRKVVEFLQQAIRDGANVDYVVGTVDYFVVGRGKNNPNSSSSQDYVFDRATREELRVDLGQFSKIKMSRYDSRNKLRQMYLCPNEYFESVKPAETFKTRYNYYDDEADIDAERKYPSRSCIFVWPRSQSWRCIGTTVDTSQVKKELMVKRMIKYVQDGDRLRFESPTQRGISKMLINDMFDRLTSYDCKGHLHELTALVVSFDATDAANRLIGVSMHVDESFRKAFDERTLPALLQHFDPADLVKKMCDVINGMPTDKSTTFLIKVLGTKCRNMTEGSKVHPYRDILVTLSRRFYENCKSSYNIMYVSRSLGCRDDDHPYYGNSSAWPKDTVSDILVLMCENYHVQEEVALDGADPSTPKNVFALFIGGIVRALAWNKVTTDAVMERIANNFSARDLERVGVAMAATEAGCTLMARCFVEVTPLEVATELTIRVIVEAKSSGVDTATDDESKSAVNLFVLPLAKGVAQSVAPHFAITLMKRLNEEGSKGRHKDIAKSLRSVAGLEIDAIISYLCQLTEPAALGASSSTSSAAREARIAVSCSGDDIAALFCCFGTAFADQSNAVDRDIFGRLLSKESLTSVFSRCGKSVLCKCVKDWVDSLDLGPAAGIVVQFCEMEDQLAEASEASSAATSSASASAGATASAEELSLLSREFLFTFAKRVIGENKTSSASWITSLSTSLSTQKYRSGGGVDGSSSAWPANSIGIILKHLCTIDVDKEAWAEDNAPSAAQFLSVTFEAIARDRSTAFMKSEFSRSAAKRLLSASDAAIALKHIGLPGITTILEDLVAALPFESAADFVVAPQSNRSKSSAGALALITIDALKLVVSDDEREKLALKLTLSFVKHRIVGTMAGNLMHDTAVSSNLEQHPSLVRDIFTQLCQGHLLARGGRGSDASASAASATKSAGAPAVATSGGAYAVTSNDILDLLRAICGTLKERPAKFRFHENTFVQKDFESAITICSYSSIASTLHPAVTALTNVRRTSEAVYLLNLLLTCATTQAESNSCAMHLALIALKALELESSAPTLEKRAMAMVMFWVSHFEGTAPAAWTGCLAAAMVPRPPGPFAAPLAASTRLVAAVFKYDLPATSAFLAEADALLSSSSTESKAIASMRVSAMLEQITSRAITTAESKLTEGPRRPTSSYKLLDDSDPAGFSLWQLTTFLRNPCSTAHTCKCVKTLHARIRRELGTMIRQGEVSISFFQRGGRGPYWITVTKLKKKAIAPTSPVPKCVCGRHACELNIYQREVGGIGASQIDQNFVDGLKENKTIFSLRSKGERPEPEVEYVEPPPKPQAEVVDLIE